MPMTQVPDLWGIAPACHYEKKKGLWFFHCIGARYRCRRNVAGKNRSFCGRGPFSVQLVQSIKSGVIEKVFDMTQDADTRRLALGR